MLFRIITTFLLVFIAVDIKSQSTFEYIDTSEYSFIITSPQEDNFNNIYSAYVHNDFNTRYSGVTSMNGYGEIINNLTIEREGMIADILHLELFEEEERILVFTSQYKYGEFNNFLNIKSLDLSLQEINDTLIVLDSVEFGYVQQVSTCRNRFGNVVAACVHGFEFNKYSNYFLEVTPYGEVLKFSSFNETNSPGQIFTIAESNNGYFCVGNTPIVINDSLTNIEYVTTDKTYNIGNAIDMKFWNSTGYIVANYEGGTVYDYSISFLDSAFQIINTKEYKDALNNVPNTLSPFGSIDFYDPNLIYVSGFELSARRYYWVAQHDSTLMRNWIRFYGTNENSRYAIFDIKASKDGGVMISGQKRTLEPQINYQGFLVKFDSNGDLLTSTVDEITLSSITVYPNPSDGLFRIKIDAQSNKKYQLTLTDSSGRHVHASNQLAIGDHSFDFSHLASGTYYYTLISDGNIKGQGSWVKM